MHRQTSETKICPLPGAIARAFAAVYVWMCATGYYALLAVFFSNVITSAACLAAELSAPSIDARHLIRVQADEAITTQSGAYNVHQLFGHCRLQQGDLRATATQINLWIDRNAEFGTEKPVKVLVEMKGLVDIQWSTKDRLQDAHWVGRLYSYFAIDIRADARKQGAIPTPVFPWDAEPPIQTIYQIPSDSYDPSVQQAQFVIDGQPTIGSEGSFTAGGSPVGGIVIDAQGNIIETVPATPVPREQQAFQLPSLPDPNAGVLPNPGSIPQTMGPAIGANPTILPNPTTGTLQVGGAAPSKIGADNFQFSGRGQGAANVEFVNDPLRGETIVVMSRGVRLRFGNAAYQSNGAPMDLGTVLLEADRAVIWTSDYQRLISGSVEGMPIEVYLDGNVIFQQGQRKVYADRMYYNAQAEIGTILGAEILTPVPQYEGILRLKADVVQQRSRQNFIAYDAAITSSRLGVPRYWLQSDRIELQDERAANDPNQYQNTQRTGTTNMEASARNNFVYLDRIPVAYWPVFNSNVDSPSFFLRSIKIKNDQIFGQQVYVDTDLYQLLGINGPDGTDWRLSTDYLSKRGFALGTTFQYNVPSFIFDGPTTGMLDVWGLRDDGQDLLGNDRVWLTPEETTRGRALLRHRQLLSRDLEFRAEVGYISDRNFLEQFFEREWDQEKDQTTTLRLRRYMDNQMLDIWGQVRLNDFFTETEWLPRLDYFMLGQPLFDRFTYYSNSHVGYAKLRTATTPTDPQDFAKFQLQPWEVESEGIRAGTRQELALPLNAGPFKFVPFVSGEVITYGEDLTGNSLTRLTGQTGVRATLPMWRTYDNVQSRIFNVNGIAHKMNWNTEFFYADTSENLDQIPLYDPLDDNAQEHFRRRLVFNTFAGALPPEFDSRSYAVRQGLQRYVTAASQDVVEDQMQFRVGLDQRWQTKRGLPGRERITDLFEFDVAGILFPKAERDNFGETAGALNYDSRLHLGDRVTLLSDGYADLFDDGLKIVSAGAMITRPGHGDWYVGLTRLTGPIDSTILHSNVNYRLNEKFIVTGGTTFDFGEVGNVGQSLSITRIGESFLAQVGISVDSGRDNAQLNFNFEPRFLSIRGLGAVGGKLVPPAGLYGLE